MWRAHCPPREVIERVAAALPGRVEPHSVFAAGGANNFLARWIGQSLSDPHLAVSACARYAVCSMLPFHTLFIPRGFLGRCRPALSRLRHIIGVHLGTALTDSGVEDARKRARSACRSIWSLWSRCRCVCAIVWTLFAWSGRWYDWLLSFVTPLGLASITTCVGWLLGVV